MQLLEGIIYLTSTIHEVKWVCERPEKLGCSQKRGEVLASSLFRIMCGVTTYFFVTKKEEEKKTYTWHIFE